LIEGWAFVSSAYTAAEANTGFGGLVGLLALDVSDGLGLRAACVELSKHLLFFWWKATRVGSVGSVVDAVDEVIE
tara:strand:- start:375 stop:599 length:225 start_codon:yes stop_codon:yes gene_type:complete